LLLALSLTLHTNECINLEATCFSCKAGSNENNVFFVDRMG